MGGRRATLGIVFADIVKSTQLFERYGDVQAHHLVSVAMEVLTRVTHAHQGTLIKTIGDEVMVTFEDPVRAVEAVCKMPPAIRDDSALAPLGMSIVCCAPRLLRNARSSRVSVARKPGLIAIPASSIVRLCPAIPSGRVTCIDTLSPGQGRHLRPGAGYAG